MRLRRAALGLLALLGILLAGYLLAAWLGSSIPQNSDWQEPAEGIDIMVETNGVHTSIIVPIVSPAKDWRQTFPSAALPHPSGEMPTHIAIGFGEREVFLTVAEWSDLSPLTALRIATVGGEGVIRLSHYIRPAPGENHRRLRIDHAQYAQLVASIEAHLPAMPAGEREVLRGSYSDDAYYAALSNYSAINTCNTWTGARLAEAGIPMGAWTPLAGGVMKWIPEPVPAN